MDLRGRFALHGSIRVIGKELRLRRLLGVERVEEGVTNSPLASYLLAQANPPRLSSRQRALTLDELWYAFLHHAWSGAIDDSYALDSLLAWAAANARGSAWRQKLVAAQGQAVLDALREHLVRKRGEAAGVVLDAWLGGHGARPLELGLVCQPLLPHGQLGVWIRPLLREALGLPETSAMKVAAQLVAAVPTALRELARQSTDDTRALLERADQWVDDAESAPP